MVTLTAFTPRQQHPTGSLAHKVHRPSSVMQLLDMYLLRKTIRSQNDKVTGQREIFDGVGTSSTPSRRT